MILNKRYLQWKTKIYNKYTKIKTFKVVRKRVNENIRDAVKEGKFYINIVHLDWIVEKLYLYYSKKGLKCKINQEGIILTISWEK